MRLLLILLLLLATGLFLAGLAVSPQPEIRPSARLSLADVERGRKILDDLNLRHIQEGEERNLHIPQKDLELSLSWLAGRQGGAEVKIDGKTLEIQISRQMDALPLYLNLALSLAPQGEVLQARSLRVGRLPLPAGLSTWILGGLLALSPAAEQARVARAMLRRASLEPGALRLLLVWRGQQLRQAMAQGGCNPAGIAGAELELYRQRLTQVASKDFGLLTGTAFALAKERSAKHDPVAENRAAITALAEVALGGRLPGAPGKAVKKGGAVLAGRGDYAQHFGLSALLAMMGGEQVSDLAGLYKELSDARQGSGFSFTDLAADKAGSRFGQYATASPQQARRVQQRLAGVQQADLFMPKIKDLPEFLPQSEFERRFGGVDQPAYKKQAEEIDRRIAQLGLYKP